MKIWLRFLLLLFPQTTQKLNGTKVKFYFLFLIGCFLPTFVNLCLITPPVLAQTQDNIEFNADKLLGLGIRQHQTGQFAREFVLENQSGKPGFTAMRRQESEHPIEEVGKDLRAMFSWLKKV